MCCAMFTYRNCKGFTQNCYVRHCLFSSSTAASKVLLQTGPQRPPQCWKRARLTRVWKHWLLQTAHAHLLRSLPMVLLRKHNPSLNLQLDAHKPLQKKTMQHDGLNKSPKWLNFKWLKTVQKNMMKIWNFCLFYVFIWGMLQSAHGSTQIWSSTILCLHRDGYLECFISHD